MTESLPMLPIDSPCAHVLVVDGDAAVYQAIEGVLQRRGFVVVHENSPRVALARLTDEDFDIVICDLNMDEIDGQDFARRVLVVRPEVPVLLMTGKKTMELAIHAVLTGAWDYLLKPVDVTQLILAIDRACRHRQLGKEFRHLVARIDSADFARAPLIRPSAPGAC